VTAEFYDLLQATEYRRIAVRLAKAWLGVPRVGLLEVGAGTGIATEVLATQTSVIVHAVEPAASMRSILLSRLAGRAELLARVRVYACELGGLDLREVADVGWCVNTLASLDAERRRDALAAMAAALTPGGRLIVQRPPSVADAPRFDLPSCELGGDHYTGEVHCEPTSAGAVRWRFVYRVSRGDAILREAVEAFDGYLVPAARFDDEVRAAGLAVIGTDEPDIVIAQRPPLH
jgi:SAM-dependent methyltransferase